MSYLKLVMPSARTSSLSGNGIIKKPTGRLARLIECLNDKRGADVSIGDAKSATGIEAKYIKETAEKHQWVIERLGYQFQPGERGRGKAGSFTWVG